CARRGAQTTGGFAYW
nr:immunoglobulin heavy chain junction region [Mus musculus]MBK4188044.1 immunoglobulin heavy chain junction region [Mus musculus]